MQTEAKPTLSAWKRMLGLVSLVVVIGGSIWLGQTLGGRMTHRPGLPVAAGGSVDPFLVSAIGVVLVILGASLYAVMLATCVLTLSYARPMYRGMKVRLWFANLIVGLFVQSGLALISGARHCPLAIFGDLLPTTVAMPICFLGPFVCVQVVFIWLQIWGPLEQITISRRLRAQGIPASSLAEGAHIGLSNPAKNSFKKFGAIEDDIGMLWFGQDRLVYRGDSMELQIPRGQLLSVERRADAGSTSSYFGAVHVIVHFKDDAGQDRCWRLHTEGNWTMTARARSLDRLANALETWRAGISPVVGSGSPGFEVRTP